MDKLLSLSHPLLVEAACLIRHSSSPNNGTEARALHPENNSLPPQAGVIKEGDLLKPREVDTVFRSASAPSTISVIIPTHNRPELLKEAIESVSSAQEVSIELVVVDDASSSPVAVEILKRLPFPTTLLRHQNNRGLGAARNSGALHAQGKYLFVLDDDDVLLPGALAALLREAQNTAAEFVFGDHIRRIDDGNWSTAPDEYHSRKENLSQLLSIENRICSGTFLVRRDYFCSLQGYREDHEVHEDYNFHLRALAKATCSQHQALPKGIGYVPTPIFRYRIHQHPTRMNVGRRLFWFATSALNHEIFRISYPEYVDTGLAQRQRFNQYEHLARALREGCDVKLACQLIDLWWSTLVDHNLFSEIRSELDIIAELTPFLMEPLSDSLKRHSIL